MLTQCIESSCPDIYVVPQQVTPLWHLFREMVEKSGSLLLESLGELVEQVYHFKDHYFEDHDLEEAAAKSDKAIWLRPIF